MFRKIFSGIWWFVKKNVVFFSGMVFGSTIGTLTTVALFFGTYGTSETLQAYQQVICGG